MGTLSLAHTEYVNIFVSNILKQDIPLHIEIKQAFSKKKEIKQANKLNRAEVKG